jgi:hypothetical protein
VTRGIYNSESRQRKRSRGDCKDGHSRNATWKLSRTSPAESSSNFVVVHVQPRDIARGKCGCTKKAPGAHAFNWLQFPTSNNWLMISKDRLFMHWKASNPYKYRATVVSKYLHTLKNRYGTNPPASQPTNQPTNQPTSKHTRM